MARKEGVIYDKKVLKAAAHAKFSSASELGRLIGKSYSWVSDALNPASKHKIVVSEQELRLLCTLCDVDYDSIILETPVAEVSQPTIQPAQPSVVINQNIMLTDDQFTWAKDAYMQLRKDNTREHEEVLEMLTKINNLLLDVYNLWQSQN